MSANTCPACKSVDTKLNGRTPKGTQRILCKSCGATFQTVVDPRKLTEATRALAARLHREGLSMRGTARVIGKGRTMVGTFLKNSESPPSC